ncbi:coxsackievirus and adenovirus receptor isoform X1 [Ascaphus truei]|uniref:coxsackievirus and adenovirus receptor isoform X1 n=1 Tax=Ascaphus truei TaxID=8439 RepID=UPI003F5956D7
MAPGSAARRLLVLLFLCSASTRALELETPNPKKLERAQGDKVTLACKFVTGLQDTGTLDIEWALLPADSQQSDQPIIMFNGDQVFEGHERLKNRVHFTSSDPKTGDASIEIINLQSSDSGTYQCSVKKLPGRLNSKIVLAVYVKPAKTRCYVEGAQEIGKDLSLKCESKEGTIPLLYTWGKLTGKEQLPPTSSFDTNTGVLSVKNASQEYSGTYRCISQNRVGTDECLVMLNVAPPSNIAGKVAGAIIGTLLGLAVLGLVIFCCCKKQKEKKYEQEVQHEIKEDVAPPKSRSSTARSYIGSNHSSLGSLSPSNMEGYSKSRYNPVPSDEHERPSSQAPNFIPPKVAGPNLSRMGAIAVMIPAQNKDGSIV